MRIRFDYEARRAADETLSATGHTVHAAARGRRPAVPAPGPVRPDPEVTRPVLSPADPAATAVQRLTIEGWSHSSAGDCEPRLRGMVRNDCMTDTVTRARLGRRDRADAGRVGGLRRQEIAAFPPTPPTRSVSLRPRQRGAQREQMAERPRVLPAGRRQLPAESRAARRQARRRRQLTSARSPRSRWSSRPTSSASS